MASAEFTADATPDFALSVPSVPSRPLPGRPPFSVHACQSVGSSRGSSLFSKYALALRSSDDLITCFPLPPIIPVLVTRPLRGHIARLVLRSAPRTLSPRCFASPTPASVPSITTNVAVSPEEHPLIAKWATLIQGTPPSYSPRKGGIYKVG